MKDKYFPKETNSNSVWILTSKNYDCIFSYYTKTKKLSQGLMLDLKTICKSSSSMYLKYYSTPEKWKEQILAMYGGEKSYCMWRDG